VERKEILGVGDVDTRRKDDNQSRTELGSKSTHLSCLLNPPCSHHLKSLPDLKGEFVTCQSVVGKQEVPLIHTRHHIHIYTLPNLSVGWKAILILSWGPRKDDNIFML
jgi:hypothetical protein